MATGTTSWAVTTMNDFTDVLETIAQNARRGHERAGDYRGEDGLLYCGRCRTRKEHRLELDTDPPKVVTVPVMCKCEEERQEAQRKEEERIKFRQDCERLRRDGITDPSYLVNTFAQDDNRNPAVSDVCRKYVDHWDEMKADNIGILFYGGVGTGKSFLACCIANALIDRCVKASVTNFPRIMNRLQGFGEDKQGFLDKLNRYDCLVIDDLGVERDTSYSVEQIYNVVDARSRSGKPLIVTTNLSSEPRTPPREGKGPCDQPGPGLQCGKLGNLPEETSDGGPEVPCDEDRVHAVRRTVHRPRDPVRPEGPVPSPEHRLADRHRREGPAFHHGNAGKEEVTAYV